MFPGVGVGVPVRITSAVAAMAWNVAVASFPGVGVAVTMTGVTQLGGKGVGVPTIVAHAVAVRAFAAAVTTFSGFGAGVRITYVGVGVPKPGILSASGVTGIGGGATANLSMGPLPRLSGP
jgi:hypothetical protein